MAEQLTRIEARSIDYVPESERHGKVWQQGAFWFLGNFQFFTITIGFIGPALGLSIGQTILAGTLGILFGTLFMACHATQGPRFGLPQMIQARAQLGYRGVVIALFGSFVTFMLFNVVNRIIISAGLNGMFGWDVTLVSVVVTVIAAALAIVGYDLLHWVFRMLLYLSLPFYVILTIAILTGYAGGTAPAAGMAPAAGEFNLTGFVAMFTAAAAYNITYAPYASDYSRYLPSSTPRLQIALSVYVGAGGAAVWLIALGAWLATSLGATDALVALRDAGDTVFVGLGSLLAVLSVLTLMATMGLNAYSAMLSAATAIDSFVPVKRTRTLRVVTISALAVIWLVASLAFGGEAVTALFNSLILMLYLLVPWTAINLVDYFFVRKGRYAIVELFVPDGLYGAWGRSGMTAYVIGLLAMVPFFVVPGTFMGPLAAQLGGVDISAIVGLVISAATYYALSRSLDVSAEGYAIARSTAQLAAEEG